MKNILIFFVLAFAFLPGCGKMDIQKEGWNFKTVTVKTVIKEKIPPRTLVVIADGGRMKNERMEFEVPQWYYNKTFVGETRYYETREYDLNKEGKPTDILK